MRRMLHECTWMNYYWLLNYWETVYHYHGLLLLQDSVTDKNIEIFTMNYAVVWEDCSHISGVRSPLRGHLQHVSGSAQKCPPSPWKQRSAPSPPAPSPPSSGSWRETLAWVTLGRGKTRFCGERQIRPGLQGAISDYFRENDHV